MREENKVRVILSEIENLALTTWSKIQVRNALEEQINKQFKQQYPTEGVSNAESDNRGCLSGNTREA